jgi:hypothetical protein
MAQGGTDRFLTLKAVVEDGVALQFEVWKFDGHSAFGRHIGCPADGGHAASRTFAAENYFEKNLICTSV